MSTVVIVGESVPSVRILAVSLRAEGFEVVRVSTTAELESSVKSRVDLVIFDHLEPTDLYRLNPRPYGFRGRLLVLSDDGSEHVRTLIEPDVIVRKPVHLHEVRRHVHQLLFSLAG